MLAANDNFQVNVYQDSGGNTNVDSAITMNFGAVRVQGPFWTQSCTTQQTIPTATDTEVSTYWGGSTPVTGNGGSVVFTPVPGTGRVRVTRAGGYYITFGVGWTSGTSGFRGVWVSVNGGATKNGYTTTSNSIATQQSATFVVLNAGDYVSVWARQNSGSSITLGPDITVSWSIVQMYLGSGTLAPTTATNAPTSSPTSATAGYYQMYAGTVTTAPSASWAAQTTHWTGSPVPAKTAGTAVTTQSPSPGGQIKVNAAGVYLVSQNLVFNSLAATSQTSSAVTKNGASVIATNTYADAWFTCPANTQTIMQAGTMVLMAANDYVTVNSLVTSAPTTLAITGVPQFTVVATQNQPYYILTSGTTQAATASTTTPLTTYWTGLPAQSLGGIWSVPSSGQIRTLQAGVYIVTWGVSPFMPGTAGSLQSWLLVNGATSNTTNRLGFMSREDTVTASGPVFTTTVVTPLNAGDYVQVNFLQTTVSSVNVENTYPQYFGVLRTTGAFGSLSTTGVTQSISAGVNTELGQIFTGSPLTSSGTGVTTTVTGPGRLRVTRSGGYHVSFGVCWSSTASSSNVYRTIWVAVNGNSAIQYGCVHYGAVAPTAALTTQPKAQQSSAFVVLSAGDYVSIWANSPQALVVDATITTSLSMVQMYDAGATIAPTTATQVPSSAPTSATKGYAQVFATQTQTTPTPSPVELSAYFTPTPSFPAKTAGSVVTVSPTPGRLVVSATAAYFVDYTVVFNSVGSVQYRNVWARVNNVADGATTRFAAYDFRYPANVAPALPGLGLMQLTAADYVSLSVFTEGANGMAITGVPQLALIATQNQPYMLLSSGTDQGIPATTNTALGTYWTGGAAQSSLGSIWSIPAAGQIRTSASGFYIVSAGLMMTGAINARQSWFAINAAVANATNRLAYVARDDQSATSVPYTFQNAAMTQLNAGDLVSMYVYQDSPTSAPTPTQYIQRFSVMKMSGAYGSLSTTTTQTLSAGANTELAGIFASSPFTSGNGAAITNPATGRLGVTQAGGYQITFGVCWAATTSTNALRSIWIGVNGVSTIQYGLTTYGVDTPVASPTAYPKSQQSTAFVQLNTGDYVSVWAFSGAFLSTSTSITTSFSIVQMYAFPVTSSPTPATTAVPSQAPTSATGGYATLFSGTAQPTPTPSVVQLASYWTGGASPVTAGSSLSTTAPTGRITVAPTFPGLYLVTYSVTFGTDAGVTDRQATVIKNNEASNPVTNWNAAGAQSAAASTVPRFGGIDAVVMAGGDFVNVNVISSTANGMSVTDPTQFSVVSALGKPYYILSSGTTQNPANSANTPLAAYWTGGAAAQSLGASWTVPSSGQIKPNIAGVYLVSFGVFWASTTNTKQSWVTIDGATETNMNRYAWSIYSDPTTTNMLTTASAVISLTASNYVRVNVYQDSGGNGNVNNGVTTHFSVVRTGGVYATLNPFTAQTVPSGAIATEFTTYFGGATLVSGGTIWSVPSAGRIKVSQGGGYLVTFGSTWQATATGYKYQWVSVNGGSTKYGQRSTSTPTIGILQSTAFVVLNPGDYVSMWGSQSTSSPTIVDPAYSTSFSVVQMYSAGTSAAPTSSTQVPTASPTSATANGYTQVFAGATQSIPATTPTVLTTYWSGSPTTPKTAGGVVTTAPTPTPTPSSGSLTVVTPGAYIFVYQVLLGSVATVKYRTMNAQNSAALTNNRICESTGGPPILTTPLFGGSALTVLSAADVVNVILFNEAADTASANDRPQMALVATRGQPYFVLASGATQAVPTGAVTPLAAYFVGGPSPQTLGSIWSQPAAGQIRVSQAGVYALFGGIFWPNYAGVRQAFWLVNGATASLTNRLGMYSRDDGGFAMQTAAIVQLAANDYVQLNAYQDSGSTQTLAYGGVSTRFSVLRVAGSYASLSSSASQAITAVGGTSTEFVAYWGTTLTSVGAAISSPQQGRLRANVAGGYYVTAGIFWSGSTATTNAFRFLFFGVNGDITIRYGMASYGVGTAAQALTTSTKAQQISAFIVLNAGDYVSVWVQPDLACTANADVVVTTQFAMTQMYDAGTTGTPSKTPSKAPSTTPSKTPSRTPSTPTSASDPAIVIVGSGIGNPTPVPTLGPRSTTSATCATYTSALGLSCSASFMFLAYGSETGANYATPKAFGPTGAPFSGSARVRANSPTGSFLSRNWAQVRRYDSLFCRDPPGGPTGGRLPAGSVRLRRTQTVPPRASGPRRAPGGSLPKKQN